MFGGGNDLSLNSFEYRGDDTIQTTLNDPLEALKEPIIRSRQKKLKDAFNELIHSVWGQGEFKKDYTFNKVMVRL